jgi:hypothetical protein
MVSVETLLARLRNVIAEAIHVVTRPRMRRVVSRKQRFPSLSRKWKRGGRTNPVAETQKQPTKEIM